MFTTTTLNSPDSTTSSVSGAEPMNTPTPDATQFAPDYNVAHVSLNDGPQSFASTQIDHDDEDGVNIERQAPKSLCKIVGDGTKKSTPGILQFTPGTDPSASSFLVSSRNDLSPVKQAGYHLRARVRTPQACNACRVRKTKCSGDRPQCTRCTVRGFQCEYRPSPYSRSGPASKKAAATLGLKPRIPKTEETAEFQEAAAQRHFQYERMGMFPLSTQTPSAQTYMDSSVNRPTPSLPLRWQVAPLPQHDEWTNSGALSTGAAEEQHFVDRYELANSVPGRPEALHSLHHQPAWNGDLGAWANFPTAFDQQHGPPILQHGYPVLSPIRIPTGNFPEYLNPMHSAASSSGPSQFWSPGVPHLSTAHMFGIDISGQCLSPLSPSYASSSASSSDSTAESPYQSETILPDVRAIDHHPQPPALETSETLQDLKSFNELLCSFLEAELSPE